MNSGYNTREYLERWVVATLLICSRFTVHRSLIYNRVFFLLFVLADQFQERHGGPRAGVGTGNALYFSEIMYALGPLKSKPQERLVCQYPERRAVPTARFFFPIKIQRL